MPWPECNAILEHSTWESKKSTMRPGVQASSFAGLRLFSSRRPLIPDPDRISRVGLALLTHLQSASVYN
jgi:hypothetical protein